MNHQDEDEFDDQGPPSHSLFSMTAADNAEVVPPQAPRGVDGLWSVSANADDEDAGESPVDERAARMSPEDNAGWVDSVDADDVVEDHGSQGAVHNGGSSVPPPYAKPRSEWDVDDDPIVVGAAHHGADADGFDFAEDFPDDDGNVDWDVHEAQGRESNQSDAFEPESDSEPSPVFDTVGSVFTAEPVEHNDDLLDEGDAYDDPWEEPQAPAGGPSLFSRDESGHRGPRDQADPSTRFRSDTRRHPGDSRGQNGPWTVTDEPFGRDPLRSDHLRGDSLWEPTSSDHFQDDHRSADGAYSSSSGGGVDDDGAPGFEKAILRLHPQDRERAGVALAVAGALLNERELVLGLVTGQMLGRPAAVVVTAGRVLVTNDRRWQPVVDLYAIDSDLRVRGRHDRDMAALVFSDDWNLSMVDGIVEVGIAMELAEHIRVIAAGDNL